MPIRPIGDWLLFGEASLDLLRSAGELMLRPFPKVIAPPPRALCEREIGKNELADLVWAVRASSRRMPFRAKCLERALCLRAMLQRRGVHSTLHYGIRKTVEADLKAHVWLSVGGKTILGGEVSPQFELVAAFPSAAEQ